MAEQDSAENKSQGKDTAPAWPELNSGGAESEQNHFAVVGVGASAGGLEAFSQLLRALPKDPGLAIVYLQHMAPNHESSLATLLSTATSLPVLQPVENTALAPNHVYV